MSSLLMLSMLSPSCATAGVQQGKASVVTSNYAKTQYPIFFNRGMFGFSQLGPVSFGTEWLNQKVNVLDHLRDDQAFTTIGKLLF